MKLTYLHHFPTVQTLTVSENKFEEYINMVNFPGDLGLPQNWKKNKSLSVRDPFSGESDSAPNELQLEMIDLECVPVLRQLHCPEEIITFYKSLDPNKFANLQPAGYYWI